MAARIYHQNMRNFGGVGRLTEYTQTFADIRTNANIIFASGTGNTGDVMIVAGFTELTNANVGPSLKQMYQGLEPTANGNCNVFLFPAGFNEDLAPTEYIGIAVHQSVTVESFASSYLYVHPYWNNRCGLYTGFYTTIAAAQTPYTRWNVNGTQYQLAATYRGICYVICSVNQSRFAVGFMHNIYAAGLPALVTPRLQQSISAVTEQFQIPVVVGGDFNVPPREFADDVMSTLCCQYTVGRITGNYLTTSANCYDFWLYNNTTFSVDGNFTPSNQSCLIHAHPTIATYTVGKGLKAREVALSDHKGISIAIS